MNVHSLTSQCSISLTLTTHRHSGSIAAVYYVYSYVFSEPSFKPTTTKKTETGTEGDLSEWLPEDTIGAGKKSN